MNLWQRTLKRIKPDRRLLVFFSFVLLSAILWFLIALNKDYTVHVNYPVVFSNLPKNKTLVSDLPIDLTILINAHGFDLMRYNITSPPPITFDLNTINLTKIHGGDAPKYCILPNLIKERIAKQIGSEIQIIEILPDTITFEFVRLVSKKIPIIPDISASFARQFIQEGKLELTPDSVRVTGPHTIVDTLKKAYTEHFDFHNLNSSRTVTLDFVPIKNITFLTDDVSLTINVEKFTESIVKAPIDFINLPIFLKITLFPSTVNVTFLVGFSNFNNIKPEMFRFVADCQNIEKGTFKRMKIRMTKSPAEVSNVRFSPEWVEYLIQK